MPIGSPHAALVASLWGACATAASLRIQNSSDPPAPRAVFALPAYFTYRLSPPPGRLYTPTAWIAAPLTHFSPQSLCLGRVFRYANRVRRDHPPVATLQLPPLPRSRPGLGPRRRRGGRAPRFVPHPARHRPLPSPAPYPPPRAEEEAVLPPRVGPGAIVSGRKDRRVAPTPGSQTVVWHLLPAHRASWAPTTGSQTLVWHRRRAHRPSCGTDFHPIDLRGH
ncbi:uncharacterized protein LOC128853800 isoform X1 [Cuculus canorus]|uniref:uncharacterized protein LOC128853800 isoform X1 n=1 Tax=Cuculus canorus TaxID=55661 RepID=UPI0023AAB1A0|nr:uncharacterized protein LOC128853800 isoform X1 [Cuculus canorus]